MIALILFLNVLLQNGVKKNSPPVKKYKEKKIQHKWDKKYKLARTLLIL